MKKRKTLITTIAIALILCFTIGGTLAWLIDKTQTVTNTFTVGNIDITLAESKTDFKMIPGYTIEKDPIVTVKADSEDCYLFVKVEKSDNFDRFITSVMADGWTVLEDVDGVYYREVASSKSDVKFSVLKDDEVTVKSTVTKEMLGDLTEATNPTVKFTAYAIQQNQDNDTKFTPAEAWGQINNPTP